MTKEVFIKDSANILLDTLRTKSNPDTMKLYYTEHFIPADTTALTESQPPPHPGLDGTPMPYRLKADDGITAVLLLCFFLTAYVLANGKRFLLQQAKDFFHTKERNSIFASSTAADFRYRLLLLFQTCVFLGICFFDYFLDRTPELLPKIHPFVLLAIYIGVCIIYLLFKWVTYSFINWIFFDKSKNIAWLESYFSIVYYLGFSLFPIVLLMVYFDMSATILIPITIVLIIFAKILMFYKCLKLFYNNLYGLLCLFLYFCALEIMPCFILFQGLIRINNLLLIKL